MYFHYFHSYGNVKQSLFTSDKNLALCVLTCKNDMHLASIISTAEMLKPLHFIHVHEETSKDLVAHMSH